MRRLLCLVKLHDWLYADGYINTVVNPSIKAKCSACDYQDYHPVSKFEAAYKKKGEAVFHPDLMRKTA